MCVCVCVCRSKYQEDEFGSDVAITVHTNNSILALQGPKVSQLHGM